MVISCSCKSGPNGIKTAAEFQDATYGEGKRAHTPMSKNGDDRKYRCTICLTERSKGNSDAPKSKKAEKSSKKLADAKS